MHAAGDRAALDPLLPIIAEELNVKRVVFSETTDELGRWRARPNFKVLGPRLGPRVKAVAEALDAAGSGDGDSVGVALARGSSVTLRLADGSEETIAPGEVVLTQEVHEGWGVSSEAGVTVALELELTEELRLEGLARELVRAIQHARKAAGLDVSDRIVLGIEAGGDVAAALSAHRSYVAGETLASEILDGAMENAEHRETVQIEGTAASLGLRRAPRRNGERS